jgi:hypothetical protein
MGVLANIHVSGVVLMDIDARECGVDALGNFIGEAGDFRSRERL